MLVARRRIEECPEGLAELSAMQPRRAAAIDTSDSSDPEGTFR
jgi:hypothetical protein